MNYENNVENKIDFYPYLNINDSHNNKSIIDSINFLGYSYNFIKIPAINEDINGHQSNLLFNSVNLTNSIDNNSSIILTPSPKKKFIIFHKKKRGRERTKTITYIKDIKIHNKLSDDNIIKKCQVSYINFIIEFMNILCSKFNINQTFLPLDYKFKNIVNKKYRNKLISQSIEEIKISPSWLTPTPKWPSMPNIAMRCSQSLRKASPTSLMKLALTISQVLARMTVRSPSSPTQPPTR